MTVSPPRPKGPPLNALRAFEAAARLNGFSNAAEELCVTPGAIAQHIKSLEAWAGSDLFVRQSQGVRLTPLGAGVIEDFSNAFDKLGEAVQNLRLRAAPKHIRIAALPSVAQLWLSPRLPEIRREIADITVSITAMETAPNLLREPYDLSIFFEDHPLLPEGIEICRDSIFPVCTAELAKELNNPSDLINFPLIQDTSWSEDWKYWTEANYPDQKIKLEGPVFSLYSLALEETRNSAGILIGHEPLVRRLLDLGELVAPLPGALPLKRSLMARIAKPATKNQALKKIMAVLLGSDKPKPQA
ncbi:LysR family transcriptional regulator [Kiloniella laminariae]|uniref:LysR family transcriptional regulator n=1 Tax=Kiloniella laminariae TaxID=454162 RepID=A0ABT4LGJ8_9PROT|nr:LysR family transcriptional regulator [Kiloniella laminariae]MCZ4280225.1 LysR family transcriptional regulator [Kiloniella laminariae]